MIPGAPSSADMGDAFLNIPEPTIEPITIVTAVKSPSFCSRDGEDEVLLFFIQH
jgi:hypothetical protein